MAYRQIMSDAFTLHVGGPYHCGPNHETPKNFAYHIEIEYSPNTRLTPEGFLLDNLCARAYFDALQYSELSCEQLSREAAYYFASKCMDSSLAWESITACVEAIPGKARIEYRLTFGEYQRSLTPARTARVSSTPVLTLGGTF